ncbi:MAG: histidine kinase [Pseudomonadota bacterium]
MRNRNTVALVTLMWITIGVVHALSRYADIVKYDLDVVFTLREVGYFVLSYSSWIIVTLVLLRILGNKTFVFTNLRLLGVFFIGALLWLPSYFALDYGISAWIADGGWDSWVQKFVATSGSVVFFYSVIYALTFALCVGLVLWTQTQQALDANRALEREQDRARLALSEQRMQLMQSQLSPHFLFNALGAISYLARRAKRDALIEAIANLGNMLRFTINNASRATITVREELRFAKDYVELQQLRFGERFDATFECAVGIEDQTCLPFCLQPMLENVFVHVVEKVEDQQHAATPSKVAIAITVEQRDERVVMCVENSRVPLPVATESTVGLGTGMKNLTTRLAHMYATAFSLDERQSASHFRVALSFPADIGEN